MTRPAGQETTLVTQETRALALVALGDMFDTAALGRIWNDLNTALAPRKRRGWL